MPRPYWLRAGIPIRQAAELQLEPRRERTSPRVVPPVTVRVGEVVCELPKIGIEIAASDARAAEAVRRALRELRPAQLHLAVRDDSAAVDWKGVAELLVLSDAELRLDVEVSDIDRARQVLEELRALLLEAAIVPE